MTSWITDYKQQWKLNLGLKQLLQRWDLLTIRLMLIITFNNCNKIYIETHTNVVDVGHVGSVRGSPVHCGLKTLMMSTAIDPPTSQFCAFQRLVSIWGPLLGELTFRLGCHRVILQIALTCTLTFKKKVAELAGLGGSPVMWARTSRTALFYHKRLVKSNPGRATL